MSSSIATTTILFVIPICSNILKADHSVPKEAGRISAPVAALALLIGLTATEPFAALRRGAVELGRTLTAVRRVGLRLRAQDNTPANNEPDAAQTAACLTHVTAAHPGAAATLRRISIGHFELKKTESTDDRSTPMIEPGTGAKPNPAPAVMAEITDPSKTPTLKPPPKSNDRSAVRARPSKVGVRLSVRR